MSIIASAPVPPSQHLGDADTTDLALIQAAIRVNPDAVRQLATAIHRDCPPWCAIETHTENEAKIDGFLIGEQHERILTELTGGNPCWTNESATATVMVESTTEGGQVVTAPRVVLSVAEGAEGQYPGGEGVQGWTGTPAQARALAAQLLAAADLVDAR
ncbi:hypothetical protein [Micromonospora sp. NPDC049274]|uniref:DUF6907 domain-containing protein n=1 Tax=Micromonospora sp. NPDC049274 TaxID=3154829 RepID=UPI00342E94BF